MLRAKDIGAFHQGFTLVISNSWVLENSEVRDDESVLVDHTDLDIDTESSSETSKPRPPLHLAASTDSFLTE